DGIRDFHVTGVQTCALPIWRAHYEKFNRVAQAWSICGVAAACRVDGGTIAEARVGLTNMSSVPVRARAVEQALVGQQATVEVIRSEERRVGKERSTRGEPPG